MADRKKEPIVIVGGGITGLATANFLQSKGIPFKCLESSSRTGGLINSFFYSEYPFDFGTNATIELTSPVKELLSIAGLEPELESSKMPFFSGYYSYENNLHHVYHPVKALLPSLFNFRALIKNLSSFKLPKKGSINPAVLYREFNGLGEIISSGIETDEFKNLSYEQIINLKNKAEKRYNEHYSSIFTDDSPKEPENIQDVYHFKNGLKSFIEKLSANVQNKIEVNTRVISITQNKGGYQVHTIKGDKENTFNASEIIMATPAYVTASLLHHFFDADHNFLHDIQYIPMYGVSLLYNKDAVLSNAKDFGFIIPELENNKFLGAIWTSKESNSKLEANQVLISLFIDALGKRDANVAEREQIVNEAICELDKMMRITTKPVYKKYVLWQKAIPIIQKSSGEINQFRQNFAIAHPGIHLAGNYLEGLSIASCIQVANKLTNSLVHV